MFEQGREYRMKLYGKEITFKVVVITDEGDVKGKLSNDVGYTTFNIKRLSTSEINSIEEII